MGKWENGKMGKWENGKMGKENLKEFLEESGFINCSNAYYSIKGNFLVLSAFEEDVFEVRDSNSKELLFSGSQIGIINYLKENL